MVNSSFVRSSVACRARQTIRGLKSSLPDYDVVAVVDAGARGQKTRKEDSWEIESALGMQKML